MVTEERHLKARLKGHLWVLPRLPSDWRPTLMERRHIDLQSRFQDIESEQPRDFDANRWYEELAACHNRRGRGGTLPAPVLRHAPWALFHDPRDGRVVLGSQPECVRWVLEEMGKRPRPRAMAALLALFLRDYPRHWPTFERIRRALVEMFGGARGRLKGLADRVDRFGLLRKDGAEQFGRLLRTHSADAMGVLVEAGLTGSKASGGFVQESYVAFVTAVQRDLERHGLVAEDLDAVLRFCGDGEALRFPKEKLRTVDALLRPFVDAPPDADVRKRLESFLLECVGDPRIQSGRWQGVSPESREVMLRWLVGSTLEDFFRLIDQTAGEFRKIWRYRKAFWGAYLREGHIRDAWVALGRDAASVARRGNLLKYGRPAQLKGGLATHSVLLMRIGDVIVAEWSHVGTCRVWTAENPRRPQLYKFEYHRDDVISHPDWGVRHHGSESARWQSEVAGVLEKRAGIDMRPADYMPRVST